MKALLTVFFVVAICLVAYAQPPGGTDLGGGLGGPPPDIPVDGGISLLIAGGALLGGKKLIESRKK